VQQSHHKKLIKFKLIINKYTNFSLILRINNKIKQV